MSFSDTVMSTSQLRVTEEAWRHLIESRGRTSYQQTPSPSLWQEYAEPRKLFITLPASWDTPLDSIRSVHVYGISSFLDRVLIPDLDNVVRLVRLKGQVYIHNAVDRLLPALIPFKARLASCRIYYRWNPDIMDEDHFHQDSEYRQTLFLNLVLPRHKLECADHLEYEIKTSKHESMGDAVLENACQWILAGRGRWIGCELQSDIKTWTEKQGEQTISKLCISLCDPEMSTEVQFMENTEGDDRGLLGTVRVMPSDEQKRVAVERMVF